MAINWPTLSHNMDWSSNIDRNPKVESLAFGDGATQRYGVGINNNPGTFNIVYSNMSQQDFVTLLQFVLAHESTGEAIKIPNMPEDPTGATFGYYMLTKHNISGDWAPTLTVTAIEVFTDA